MANREGESVLRFTCHSCGTHLGVDSSLAGLEAPCPKCGAQVMAPTLNSDDVRIPSAGVTRGVAGGSDFRVQTRSRSSGSGERSRSEGVAPNGSRKVYPTAGRMADEDGSANLKALIKIGIAVGLVLLIVILVVWYLNRP